MSAHTPGPWAVRFDMISGDGDRAVVAYLTDSEGSECAPGHQLANARLIAAAPALLAACEAPGLDAAHDALSELCEGTGYVSPEAWRAAAVAMCLALNHHHEQRRAAIAAARGE